MYNKTKITTENTVYTRMDEEQQPISTLLYKNACTIPWYAWAIICYYQPLIFYAWLIFYMYTPVWNACSIVCYVGTQLWYACNYLWHICKKFWAQEPQRPKTGGGRTSGRRTQRNV